MQWTDEGVAFYPAGRSYGGNVHPMRAVDPSVVVVRWYRLAELEAVHPWPCFRARWHPMRASEMEARSGPVQGAGGHTFGPEKASIAGLLSPVVAPDGFAAQVSALFEHVARHKPSAVRRGWLDDPDVDWEPAEALPDTAPSTDGAFRSAGDRSAVIVRGAPSAMEALLEWLASGSERPWSEHPREVHLTADEVFVLRRDRSVGKLPLRLLRARLGSEREDAVYVFGRRRGLLATHREGCPVRAALDRRLAALEEG